MYQYQISSLIRGDKLSRFHLPSGSTSLGGHGRLTERSYTSTVLSSHPNLMQRLLLQTLHCVVGSRHVVLGLDPCRIAFDVVLDQVAEDLCSSIVPWCFPFQRHRTLGRLADFQSNRFSRLFPRILCEDCLGFRTWFTLADLVDGNDAKVIFVVFEHVRGGVREVGDGFFGQSQPSEAACSAALYNVASDRRATVIIWRLPGQLTGCLGNICDLGC